MHVTARRFHHTAIFRLRDAAPAESNPTSGAVSQFPGELPRLPAGGQLRHFKPWIDLPVTL